MVIYCAERPCKKNAESLSNQRPVKGYRIILLDIIIKIAAQHGLMFNLSKTEYMSYNLPRPVPSSERVFVNNKPLEEVFEFKYLGSNISSTAKDIHVRKGQAWNALQKLDVFWKSGMSRKTKTKIFRTAVEPVLLYGCETWTLKESLIKELDGLYTRMLRRVFNVHWKSHTTNVVLYGNIPKLSTTIKNADSVLLGISGVTMTNLCITFYSGNLHTESGTMGDLG